MTQPAEQGSQGFNPIDQLAGERDRRMEDLDRVVKADILLQGVNYLMYTYGPVKFFPDYFKYAQGVFNPGEYSLPEVPLETTLGDMRVHVSAKYGDVPFYDEIGEIMEVSLHFRMGEHTSVFTVPRTDFRDRYNADSAGEDVEDEDEYAQIKARAEQLPSLDALTKAEYVFDLIRSAYDKSGLVSNGDNPDVPKKHIE